MKDRYQLSIHLRDFNNCDASLETWLVLRSSGLAFEACCHADSEGCRTAPVPIGHLPVLVASDCPIWDSIAVSELIAELQPSLWPLDPRQRAHARAVANEIHSGFSGIRRLLPLDLLGHFEAPGKLTRATHADVRRLIEICEHFRGKLSTGDGPFLFGEFSIVDAILTPIAARVVTYSIDVQDITSAYVDALMAWPPMVEWQEHASNRIEAIAAGEPAGSLESRWSYSGIDPTAIETRETEAGVPVGSRPPPETETRPAATDESSHDQPEEAKGEKPVPQAVSEPPPPVIGRDPSLDMTIYERPEGPEQRPDPAQRGATTSDPQRPPHLPPGEISSTSTGSDGRRTMPPPPRARDLPWIPGSRDRSAEAGSGLRKPGRPLSSSPETNDKTGHPDQPDTGPLVERNEEGSTGPQQDRSRITIQPIGAGTRRRR
ncbi:MAG: hypothetical protein R3C70_05470 [Geminicoccaceae bacterium]